MKIANEIQNHLLKRREVIIELTHSGSPSTPQITKEVAEHFKVAEDHVSVKSIHNRTGTSHFIVDALVYDSAEQRIKIEPKIKAKKGETN